MEINPKTIYEELPTTLEFNAPSYPTVTKWAKCFCEGREDVNNDPRSARPLSELTHENIELVREVISNDSHSTYVDIIPETFLSYRTIERIIRDCLKMKKITLRWLPHQQKQERVKRCRENLAKFRDGSSWRLCDIITDDGTSIYYRQIYRKSTNAKWLGNNESPTTIVR